MQLSERIGRGSILLFVAGAAATLIGYFFRVYLSHALSIEEFGLFFSVLAFVGLFGMFKELGVSQALTKYVAEFHSQKNYGQLKSVIIIIAVVQFIIGALVFFPLIAAAPYLAAHFFNNPSASLIFGILLAELILNFAFLAPVFQGLQKFHVLAFIELARILIVFLIVPRLIHLGATGVALGYFLASMIINVVFYGALIYYTPYLLRATFSFDRTLAKHVLLFGATVIVGSLAAMIISRADVLFLTYFRSLTEVAWYTAALPTASLLMVFATPLVATVFPSIAELWGKNDREKIGSTISTVLRLLFAFTVPVALVLIAFADVIMPRLFGQQYASSALALQILTFSMLFTAGFQILAASLTATGRPGRVTKITLIAVGVHVLLSLLLVPALGIMGSVLVAAISSVLMFWLAHRALGTHINFRIGLAPLVKILGCGVLTLLVIAILKSMLVLDPIVEAIVLAAAGMFVYSVAAIKLRIVTRQDARMLFKAVRFPAFMQRPVLFVLEE